jgi:hypothetical protein
MPNVELYAAAQAHIARYSRQVGKLPALNCSRKSIKGTFHALGITGIEPMPPESNVDCRQLAHGLILEHSE